MVQASTDLLNPSAIVAEIVAVLPLAFGLVVKLFSAFVEPKARFRKRASYKRSTLVESLCVMHCTLLNHARKIDDDSVLRGDGREEPDLVSDYTSEIFRLFRVFRRVEGLLAARTIADGAMLAALSVGLVGLVLALLYEGVAGFVFFGSLCALLVQIVVVVVVNVLSSKMDVLEDVS